MQRKERAFDPGGQTVGEVTPVDTSSLTVRQLGEAAVHQGVQLHRCLEAHIAEQTAHNAAQQLAMLSANEKREAMGNDLAEVKGELRGLVLALGIRKPGEGEVKPKAAGITNLGPLQAAGFTLVPWAMWGVWHLAHAAWPHLIPAPPSLPANPT